MVTFHMMVVSFSPAGFSIHRQKEKRRLRVSEACTRYMSVQASHKSNSGQCKFTQVNCSRRLKSGFSWKLLFTESGIRFTEASVPTAVDAVTVRFFLHYYYWKHYHTQERQTVEHFIHLPVCKARFYISCFHFFCGQIIFGSTLLIKSRMLHCLKQKVYFRHFDHTNYERCNCWCWKYVAARKYAGSSK